MNKCDYLLVLHRVCTLNIKVHLFVKSAFLIDLPARKMIYTDILHNAIDYYRLRYYTTCLLYMFDELNIAFQCNSDMTRDEFYILALTLALCNTKTCLPLVKIVDPMGSL